MRDSYLFLSHKSIAQNFPNHIFEIICLNWDNLIERAFRELNKEVPKINKETLCMGEGI